MIFCSLFSFTRRLLSWDLRQDCVTNKQPLDDSKTPFRFNTTTFISLRNRGIFYRLPPEITMLIWDLCIKNEDFRNRELHSRNKNPRSDCGIIHALSSEQALMKGILSLFYSSAAFGMTEIYGLRIARREPSKHLKVNLAVVIPLSRIVPMYIEDTRYPQSIQSDLFEIFSLELREFLATATVEQQHLWGELSNRIDFNKTVRTISLRFQRTLDALDLHCFYRILEIFESLEEIDIAYLVSTLREPSFYRKDLIDSLARIESASPIIDRIPAPKWVLIWSPVLSHSNRRERNFWRITHHWQREYRRSRNGHQNSRSSLWSSILHLCNHLGQLARLADLKTVLHR